MTDAKTKKTPAKIHKSESDNNHDGLEELKGINKTAKIYFDLGENIGV